MEQIIFVKNGDLKTVNDLLKKGAEIKSVHPVAEGISAYGYAGGESDMWHDDYRVGDVFAYIVVKLKD